MESLPAFAKHLLVVAALVSLQAAAQPLISYSTFGEPGDTYNTSSGWLVNGSSAPPQPFVGEAFAFTPGISGYLSQVRLVLSGNAGNLANVCIAANSGSVPGTVLEKFLNVPVSGLFGLNNPLTSLNSVATPLLQPGTTYWLCVEPAFPTASFTVNQNSLGLMANQAQEFSPSAWIARGSRATFAFDVTVSAVPEPSTIALAGLALPLFPSLARRFYTGFRNAKEPKVRI